MNRKEYGLLVEGWRNFLNESEELSKVNHNWIPIDDHIPDCVFYADARQDPPEVVSVKFGFDPREDKSGQPMPSKCLKIKIDTESESASFYYDRLLESPEAILKVLEDTDVIRMLDSCNLEEGEICIELLNNEMSFDDLKEKIIDFILDQSDFLPRSATYRS